jgi:hypothetical protein
MVEEHQQLYDLGGMMMYSAYREQGNYKEKRAKNYTADRPRSPGEFVQMQHYLGLDSTYLVGQAGDVPPLYLPRRKSSDPQALAESVQDFQRKGPLHSVDEQSLQPWLAKSVNADVDEEENRISIAGAESQPFEPTSPAFRRLALQKRRGSDLFYTSKRTMPPAPVAADDVNGRDLPEFVAHSFKVHGPCCLWHRDSERAANSRLYYPCRVDFDGESSSSSVDVSSRSPGFDASMPSSQTSTSCRFTMTTGSSWTACACIARAKTFVTACGKDTRAGVSKMLRWTLLQNTHVASFLVRRR